MAVGTTCDQLLKAVAEYYGQGSDQWLKIAYEGVTSSNINIIKQVPGVTVTVNSKGEYIGYDYEYPFTSSSNPVSAVNSNVPNASTSNGAFKAKVNGTQVTTPQATKTIESGARKVGTGAKVASVACTTASVVCAAGLGCKLGKMIGESFYDSGASWAWNEEDWEDWVSGFDPLPQAVFRALFDIDGDGSTMYLPEDMLASMYLMMEEMGIYSESGEYEASYTGSTTGFPYPDVTSIPVSKGRVYVKAPYYSTAFTSIAVTGTDAAQASIVISNDNDILVIAPANANITTSYINYNSSGNEIGRGTIASTTSSTFNGTPFKIAGRLSVNITEIIEGHKVSINTGHSTVSNGAKQIGTLIIDGTVTQPSPVEGVEDDPNAPILIDPSLITGTTPEEVLQQLKQNYPQLFSDSIYEDVPQDDDTSRRITYIPVPYPNTTDKTKPTTGDNHQDNPQVNPDTNTSEQLQDIIELLTKLITDDDVPDTGDGDTPVVPAPTGSASSLWKIYNPTQAQIDAFGAWLWDSSFVEQIKKLFNDPMQGIIGVHKVFATPSTGGTANIKVGYLDSEISSLWVDNQYTTVNCGSVNLREYFGNVFDYSPYTKVSLYLPFIGIVDLDVGDVMRATISVKYHVDVLTGACLVDVKVNRDGAGGVLYQYAGSAIVQYPVSSGTYLGAIAGVAAVATGAIATVASAGTLAPMAMGVAGAAAGLSHIHANVAKSGSFTGCAGAMGSKKPYLIVSRPQTAMAGSFRHFTGMPANSHVKLDDCDGYTVVKSVYVKGISRATEEEKDMIEAELKKGVLV